MLQRLVTVNAVSAGGYCGKSIVLDLTNNTTQYLSVDIDPALIFKPEGDTGAQNLVLLGNESIALEPGKNASMRLQTFCGKSYGHSPAAFTHYNYWKQGDSNMIRTLTYVKQNSIDIYLAQRAVWMYTNGYCLNSIYSAARSDMSEKFVKYIASLRNRPIPEYYLEYKLDTAQQDAIIYGGDAKVYVTMNWKNDGYYRHMYLKVLKANGELYKTIEGEQQINSEGVTVKVEFDPRRDLKGGYVVQLTDDKHQVWGRKEVFVGMNSCNLM